MTDDRKRHKDTAQRMPSGKKADWGDGRIISREELYTVPSELVTEILIVSKNDFVICYYNMIFLI